MIKRLLIFWRIGRIIGLATALKSALEGASTRNRASIDQLSYLWCSSHFLAFTSFFFLCPLFGLIGPARIIAASFCDFGWHLVVMQASRLALTTIIAACLLSLPLILIVLQALQVHLIRCNTVASLPYRR